MTVQTKRGEMAYPRMTYQLTHAAATDAGNRSMREAGRTKWNEDDYNASVREFNRLWWPEEEIK